MFDPAVRSDNCRTRPKRCVMVKASPAAAFVVAKTNFLFEFEVVPLDPPAQLGGIDHVFERDVRRQRGKPIVVRFGLALGTTPAPPSSLAL